MDIHSGLISKSINLTKIICAHKVPDAYWADSSSQLLPVFQVVNAIVNSASTAVSNPKCF